MTNWKKYFFLAMEKQAIMGAIVGGITAMSTMSDIKLNKAKMKLATPGSDSAVNSADPYSSQFSSTSTQTPNRSLFG